MEVVKRLLNACGKAAEWLSGGCVFSVLVGGDFSISAWRYSVTVAFSIEERGKSPSWQVVTKGHVETAHRARLDDLTSPIIAAT